MRIADQYKEERDEALSHFLIIGGEKCNSTYLHSALREHPDIFIPKKGVPFFKELKNNNKALEIPTGNDLTNWKR